MNETKLSKQYTALVTDLDFENLESLIKQPNIFKSLKMENHEIRHSNFLGWLLDPSQSHGLGDQFLKRFLIDILQDHRSAGFDVADAVGLAKNEFTQVIRESLFNIDILIEFNSVAVIIENKFYSEEHSDQLRRYHDNIQQHFGDQKKKVFVFLSLDGKESSMNEIYIPYGYKKVIKHLTDLLAINQISLTDRVKIYIEDYLYSLQKNIMKDSSENLLATKIYQNHKELFDFVMNNTDNDLNFISNKINDFLRDKEYQIGSEDFKFSRFTTSNLAQILKPIKTTKRAWKKKEPLLFEFSLEKENNRIVFLISVSDFNMDINNKIHECLKDHVKFDSVEGANWKLYGAHNEDFEFSNFHDVKYIREKFDVLFNQVKNTIDKVEQLILAEQEAFKLLYANQ